MKKMILKAVLTRTHRNSTDTDGESEHTQPFKKII